jgi:glycosyltransferase involved in cell wall biosynthesis
MPPCSHILLYTDEWTAGGVAQYNHALMCALVKRGYRVTCISPPMDTPLTRRQIELGISHTWLSNPAKEFVRALTDITEPAKHFQETRPDLIIFSNCSPVSNYAAKTAACRAGMPFVIIENFADSALADRFAGLLDGLAYHYGAARAVVAVSHMNLLTLRQSFHLPADIGQIVCYGRPAQFFDPPNPANRRRLRAEWNIPADAILFFTAARLEPIKGYQYQLGALEMLRRWPAWSQIYFAWAGDGSLREQLAARIEELGLSDRIKLLGVRWDVIDWLGRRRRVCPPL